MSYSQLTLLTHFDKDTARQLELTEALIKEIGDLKYYRTCVEFSDFLKPEKAYAIDLIDKLLYYAAHLAFSTSRGLPKHRTKELPDYMKLTVNKGQVSMVEPHAPDILSEFFGNGFRRMRTLLAIYKDLLRHNQIEVDEIKKTYNSLCYLR